MTFPSEATISAVGTGDEHPEASRFRIENNLAGRRVDHVLAVLLNGELSRSRIQDLIVQGQVTVDGLTVLQPKRRVALGQEVALVQPEPLAPEPEPEEIPLDVVYEDSALLVIDKPAGLVVHPGPGNWSGTLVNALLHHCKDSLSGIGGVRRPGIVHRLDKDTSGLIVVAKTDAAHRSLAAQFAAHGRDGRLERAYRALVWGRPTPPAGSIETHLGRSNSDRLKRSVVEAARADARHAITRYRTEEVLAFASEPLASLVTCVLETGRTHQIRVHMAHVGHPLIGDALYGRGFRSKAGKVAGPAGEMLAQFPRQALHAFRLGFVHPGSGEPMRFESSLPRDLQTLLDVMRNLDRRVGQGV